MILFGIPLKPLACVSLIVVLFCASRLMLAQSGANPSSSAGNAHSSGAPPIPPRKTPITEGGMVDSGLVVFQDIAKAAGLSGRSEIGATVSARKRDDFSSNRHHALAYCLSMIFAENRYPLFGIML